MSDEDTREYLVPGDFTEYSEPTILFQQDTAGTPEDATVVDSVPEVDLDAAAALYRQVQDTLIRLDLFRTSLEQTAYRLSHLPGIANIDSGAKPEAFLNPIQKDAEALLKRMFENP